MEETPIKIRGNIIFNIVLLCGCIFLTIYALRWPFNTRFFPLVSGIGASVFITLQLIIDLVKAKGKVVSRTEEKGDVAPISKDLTPMQSMRRLLKVWAWLLGLYIGIMLIGFTFSVPVFVFAYFLREGKEKLRSAILASVIIYVFTIILFELIIRTPWPTPLLDLERYVLQYINMFVNNVF